jgi:hypothetical protein
VYDIHYNKVSSSPLVLSRRISANFRKQVVPQSRQLVTVLGAIFCITLLAGCLSTNSRGVEADNNLSCGNVFPRRPLPGAGPAWIITSGGLKRLIDNGLPVSIIDIFDRPSTILLVSRGRPVPYASRASLAFYYTSAAELDTALQHGQVPSTVKYLLLDLERWPLTPQAEQARPIVFLRNAIKMAHSYGKCLIFTPALDLLRPWIRIRSQSTRVHIFANNIARPGGSASDVFDIQSQQYEGTPYVTTLIHEIAHAARSLQPAEPVFVGISTNPDGRRVTVADLLEMYRTGESVKASGYWLNIPVSNAECPQCGIPKPRLAVSMLEILARSGWR